MKYEIDIHYNGFWETIAHFSEKVSIEIIIAFAVAQFENGNSLTTPADNIAVVDENTGEVLWDWRDGLSDPSAFILETNSDEAFDAFLQAFTANDDVKRRDPEDWDYDDFETEYQNSL